jgi:hypothetical protein
MGGPTAGKRPVATVGKWPGTNTRQAKLNASNAPQARKQLKKINFSTLIKNKKK